VDLTAVKSPLRSLEFTTLKIKDAICDRFLDQFKLRPSVNTRTRHAHRRLRRCPQLHGLSRYLRRSAVQARLARRNR
jgi:hypothetical protein